MLFTRLIISMSMTYKDLKSQPDVKHFHRFHHSVVKINLFIKLKDDWVQYHLWHRMAQNLLLQSKRQKYTPLFDTV